MFHPLVKDIQIFERNCMENINNFNDNRDFTLLKTSIEKIILLKIIR